MNPVKIKIANPLIKSALEFHDFITTHNIHKNKHCDYDILCTIELNKPELVPEETKGKFQYQIQFDITGSDTELVLEYIEYIYSNHNIIKLLINEGCDFTSTRTIMTSAKLYDSITVYERFEKAITVIPTISADDLQLIINGIDKHKFRQIDNLRFVNMANTSHFEMDAIMDGHLDSIFKSRRLKGVSLKPIHNTNNYYVRLPDIMFSLYDINSNNFPKILLQYLSVNKLMPKKINELKAKILAKI